MGSDLRKRLIESCKKSTNPSNKLTSDVSKQKRYVEPKGKNDKDKLDERFLNLNSAESYAFTEQVVLTIAKEMERRFPGVKFFLKCRFKSAKSYEEKEDKVLKRGTQEEKEIYDGIGICLVIQNIPFGADTKHVLCQRYLALRADKGSEIENETLKYEEKKKAFSRKEAIDSLEIEKMTEELARLGQRVGESSELYQARKEFLDYRIKELEKKKKEHTENLADIERILEVLQEQYESIDNDCNNALARHALKQIIESPEIQKDFKIKRIPNRTKVHDGGKSGYYIAYHDSVKSSKLKYWLLEMQSMSQENYLESREGKAQHSKCQGKERVIPRLGESEEENRAFIETMLDSTPIIMVYQNERGPDKEGKGARQGQLYICSQRENVLYHYLEALKGKPKLFEQIATRDDLFSPIARIIRSDGTEITFDTCKQYIEQENSNSSKIIGYEEVEF